MKLENLNQHIWDAYGNEYIVLSSTTQGYTLQDIITGSIFPFVDSLDKYYDKKMVLVSEGECTKLKELLDEAEKLIKALSSSSFVGFVSHCAIEQYCNKWLEKYRGLKK